MWGLLPSIFGASAISRRGELTGSRRALLGSVGVCGPLKDVTFTRRFRVSVSCSKAQIAETRGKCVAFSKTIRTLLSRSEGKTSRKGRMTSGMRFWKPVSLANGGHSHKFQCIVGLQGFTASLSRESLSGRTRLASEVTTAEHPPTILSLRTDQQALTDWF